MIHLFAVVPLGVNAFIDAWGGLTLAFYTDWPTSFWITALSGLIYFMTLAGAGRGVSA